MDEEQVSNLITEVLISREWAVTLMSVEPSIRLSLLPSPPPLFTVFIFFLVLFTTTTTTTTTKEPRPNLDGVEESENTAEHEAAEGYATQPAFKQKREESGPGVADVTTTRGGGATRNMARCCGGGGGGVQVGRKQTGVGRKHWPGS